MSYHLDEYELELSYERERQLERDNEREPYRFRARRQRSFSVNSAAPLHWGNAPAADQPIISPAMREFREAA